MWGWRGVFSSQKPTRPPTGFIAATSMPYWLEQILEMLDGRKASILQITF